jgi:heme-degrading monooxygenase HmoA
MSHVILINPFEVAPGREDECLEMWERAAAFMRQQPGFRSTRLHRSILPGARFHFINVAEWDSVETFRQAIGSEQFQRITAGSQVAFPHHPGLYEVIRT